MEGRKLKGNMDFVLTIAELADIFKVSETSIKSLRARGGFVKPIRVGNQMRWRVSDVKAWIDQQLTDEEAK